MNTRKGFSKRERPAPGVNTDFIADDIQQALAQLDATADALHRRLDELLRDADQHRPELLAVAKAMGVPPGDGERSQGRGTEVKERPRG